MPHRSGARSLQFSQSKLWNVRLQKKLFRIADFLYYSSPIGLEVDAVLIRLGWVFYWPEKEPFLTLQAYLIRCITTGKLFPCR
jgi:hypothetical protein